MSNPLASDPLVVNRDDARIAPLLLAAGRIAELLDTANRRNDDFLRYTADLALGAVYALILSAHFNYQHRSGPAETDKPPLRAREFAAGRIRPDGQWMAGFHLNSGIFRLAAVYHRSLKIALDTPADEAYVGPLRKAAKLRYVGWKDDNAFDVHTEVNTVKHDANGLVIRTVTPPQALAALGEILDLLERWSGSSPAPAQQSASA